jgi:GT2 family glycosyltransferase
MKYSIVIPTYKNFQECLAPCLQSVAQFTDMRESEIIVVANGAEPAARDYINSLGLRNLRLIWFNEPLGYTKAANIGIQQCEGEFTVLLNDDCVLLDWQKRGDWLYQLEAPFVLDDSIGVTGPSKLFYNPTNQTTGPRNGAQIGAWFTIFFCAMIRTQSFKTFGLLDEVFSPGYGEDIDFCFRLNAAGLRSVQVPDDKEEWEYTTRFPIFHRGGSSFKSDGDALFKRAMEIVTQRWGAGQYATKP